MQQFIDKLIDSIRKEKDKDRSGVYSASQCDTLRFAYGHTIDIVNQLAEEYKGGWIPCSERMPDEVNRYYLITYRRVIQGEFFYNTKIDYLSTLPDGTKSWEIEEAKPFVKVTAWQQLPEPYKEKQT